MAKTRADKALLGRRVDDILRIRLDGAEWWDVRQYVREKEADPLSPWFVAEGGKPLSDHTIRYYQTSADKLMLASGERSRKKRLRRHLAQRRNLYARAVTTGELRTALAVLVDEAHLLGLYPAHQIKHTGDGPAGSILITSIETIALPDNGLPDNGPPDDPS
jgi:hypothetical protein